MQKHAHEFTETSAGRNVAIEHPLITSSFGIDTRIGLGMEPGEHGLYQQRDGVLTHQRLVNQGRKWRLKVATLGLEFALSVSQV